MIRKFNENEIDEIVDILQKDGVICVPTDTVYGLCTCMNSYVGYTKLISIKKRPNEKNFPLMCSDINQVESIAELSPMAVKIINHFMPGPLTIILKKKSGLPSYVTNSNTIAIRLATSSVLKEIIEKVGSPIFMTSANISGEFPCNDIDKIEATFPSLDGLLLGKPLFGVSSTIVDCSSIPIKILREGPISLDDINSALK